MAERVVLRDPTYYLGAKGRQERLVQWASLSRYFAELPALESRRCKFLMYWGAGAKSRLGASDYSALRFLLDFVASVEQSIGMKAHVVLIFTDTHALWNGYNEERLKSYAHLMRGAARDAGVEWLAMSELLAPYIKDWGCVDIGAFIKRIEREIVAGGVPMTLLYDASFRTLVRSALRHSQRLTGNPLHRDANSLSAEQAAYGYVRLNELERKVVVDLFGRSVFLTYSGEVERRLIQPNLLTVQICSMERGQRARPWFLEDEMEPA